MNTQITEDYVSFETAKLLKQKGFNVETEHELWYVAKEFSTGCHWNSCTYKVGETTREYDRKYCIAMPTLQMAMKWLREIYKLEVRSTYDYDKDSWWGNINPMFEETDENSYIYQKALGFDYQGKSYEEACEEAIKYCLTNLI